MAVGRPLSMMCRRVPSKQKYPGIKVTIHAGFSNVLDERINQQLESKRLDADLAILQTVQRLTKLQGGRGQGRQWCDKPIRGAFGATDYSEVVVTHVARLNVVSEHNR